MSVARIVCVTAMTTTTMMVLLVVVMRPATAQVMPPTSYFSGEGRQYTVAGDMTSHFGMYDATIQTYYNVTAEWWTSYISTTDHTLFDDAAIVLSGTATGTDGSLVPVLRVVPELSLMTYSSVLQIEQTVIQLAISTDGAQTWTAMLPSNQTLSVLRPVTIQCRYNSAPAPLETCTGVMVDEVSFILFDPSDPNPARAWKVFTHNWFYNDTNGQTHFQWGYISLYTSATLTGGGGDMWARESLLGWTDTFDGVPVSHENVKQNLSDIEQLSDCTIFSEPSALIRPAPNGAGDAIYLALGCVYLYVDPHTGKYSGRIRMELLSSIDHAASFQYVGRLLTAEDAIGLGFPLGQFNGGNLFAAPDDPTTIYLSASPAGPVQYGNQNGTGYVGCVVVRITDLQTATIDRDPTSGLPTVVRYINSAVNRTQCGSCESGACTYAGTHAVGYVSNWLQLPFQPFWQTATTPFFEA